LAKTVLQFAVFVRSSSATTVTVFLAATRATDMTVVETEVMNETAVSLHSKLLYITIYL